MTLGEIRQRVWSVWRWQSSRSLLVVALGITAILSLVQIRLDPLEMLIEVTSTFITCVTITFVTATLTEVVGIQQPARHWGRTLLLLGVLATGGALGGLLAWGVNQLLFPYHISHPRVYILMVAALAVIFGLALVAHETVTDRLADTAERLAEKEVQEQRLSRLKTKAELEALRARVNPHFLFNTLNSIASLIPADPVRAEDTVQRLSNLYRYVLSAGERGVVPLADELDIVEEYLRIEKVRLGSRLEYAIERDGREATVTIPAMLLQPLVENAVKYGVASDPRGGRIDVRCRCEKDRCRIRITDTGAGFDPETGTEGFGIGGVRQRLELSYPDEHRFEIESGPGTTITIEIPTADDTARDPRRR